MSENETNKSYEHIEEILKNDKRLKNETGELRTNLLHELVNNYDTKLFELLLSDEKIKNTFFIPVKDTFVFKHRAFKDFIDYNTSNNSYSKYLGKQIGLYVDDVPLADRGEVVLNFPFKDCVLEGGQRTEDGTDTYFEYDEKTKDFEKKQSKRREIFYNEILARDEIDQLFAPKAFCNAKKYDKDGEQQFTKFERNADGTITDNLIIKGNNLLALHSLYQQFAGKVKLIYIDPPYNTGNDGFAYNNSFNHSTWLTFMKNRLEIARELLREDGVIMVQCDDNEQAYLKVLMDDVFGNRFLNNVAVKMSEASGVKMNHAKGRFPKLKEFILMYKMPNFKGFITVDKYEQKEWDPENNIFIDNLTEEQRSKLIELEAKEINDDTDVIEANEILKKAKKISLATKLKELDFENEDEKTEWLFKNSYRIIKTAGSSSLATIVKSLDNVPKQDIAAAVSKKGVLFFYITDFNRDTKQPRLQVIFADSNIFKNPCDFWQDIKTTGAIAEEGGVKLSNGKKPEKILYRLIKMITNEGDVVLDYHLGSGTTAAVAHKMKRQYIGIEQLDYRENDSVIRLKNVINGDDTGISSYEDVNWQGGGEFVYLEMAQKNEQARKLINECESYDDLMTVFKELCKRYFLNYNFRINDFSNKTSKDDRFKALPPERRKEIFVQMLDLNQMWVNASEMNDKRFGLSEEDKKVTNDFYGE